MDGKWLVYGKLWFAVTVDADNQDEAEIQAQTLLMNNDNVRFMVLSTDSELFHA